MKILLFVFAFITLSALAQTPPASAPVVNDEFTKGYEAGKKEALKSSDHQPSIINRATKNWDVQLSWGADYTLITQQLIIGKYLTANDIIGLKGGHGKVKYGDWTDHQLNISLFYKKFLANSFYISPEVVYLKLEETEDDPVFDQDNEFYRGFGAGVRIGNQWNWTNFTIGCDWIGLGKLFLASENTENRSTYATLLNFYAGWSF